MGIGKEKRQNIANTSRASGVVSAIPLPLLLLLHRKRKLRSEHKAKKGTEGVRGFCCFLCVTPFPRAFPCLSLCLSLSLGTDWFACLRGARASLLFFFSCPARAAARTSEFFGLFLGVCCLVVCTCIPPLFCSFSVSTYTCPEPMVPSGSRGPFSESRKISGYPPGSPPVKTG